MRKINFILIFAALSMSFVQNAVKADGSSIETFTVVYKDVADKIVYDGIVEASSRATVSAEVSATIVGIFYDVDEYVEKDAVILRFDDTRIRAAHDQAVAGVNEATAKFEEAKVEQQRTRDLHKKKLVSKANLDRANASLKSSQARLDAANAAHQQVKEQFQNTVVTAPYSGIVTDRHVEVGETAAIGTPLMTGISLENLRVAVNVSQSNIHAIRALDCAEIILSSGEILTSRDLVIFPYADSKSNTFKVRANLKGGTPNLFPGMFVKVVFVVGETQRLLVPLSAIVYRSELIAVYVVDDQNRLSLRQVRVGSRVNGNQVEVLAGLDQGERIALKGLEAGRALNSYQTSP